jgi:hypothetical protein
MENSTNDHHHHNSYSISKCRQKIIIRHETVDYQKQLKAENNAYYTTKEINQ